MDELDATTVGALPGSSADDGVVTVEGAVGASRLGSGTEVALLYHASRGFRPRGGRALGTPGCPGARVSARATCIRLEHTTGSRGLGVWLVRLRRVGLVLALLVAAGVFARVVN